MVALLASLCLARGTSYDALVSILDAIIRAAAESDGDHGPLVAEILVCLEKDGVFLGSPGALIKRGLEMIHPAQADLAAIASREMAGEAVPPGGPVLGDDAHEQVVLPVLPPSPRGVGLRAVRGGLHATRARHGVDGAAAVLREEREVARDLLRADVLADGLPREGLVAVGLPHGAAQQLPIGALGLEIDVLQGLLLLLVARGLLQRAVAVVVRVVVGVVGERGLVVGLDGGVVVMHGVEARLRVGWGDGDVCHDGVVGGGCRGCGHVVVV